MTESMSTGVRGNSIDRTTTTVSIKCVDLRGLDQHGANIVFRTALDDMGLWTPPLDPPPADFPSIPNRYGDTAWVGIYSHPENNVQMVLEGIRPKKHIHKIFYCSSLEELQINMDEYEREFNNPGDGTKPAAIFKRYN